MVQIPNQLRNYELLKIYGPDADCSSPGKQPVGSTREGPFYYPDDPELVSHIQSGGNVGLPLNGPLVVFDIDDPEFGKLLDRQLPPTFSVRTGSGGEHRYYHCPEWSDNRQFTVDGSDYGSIRAEGWQVVIPPSIHPETNQRYRVKDNQLITSVGSDSIDSVTQTAANTASGGGGGGDPGGSGGGCVGWGNSQVPEEYPSRKGNWSELKSWLEGNGFLSDLNQTTSDDWSGLEFKLAKCLAEGGFSEKSISDALDRLDHRSKWHTRGTDYQRETVRTAIQSAVNDPYVKFSTSGDMDGDTSESRKTESGMGSTGPTGGENDMTDFNDKLSVPVLEASEGGDSFKKIVLVEGNDNGERFEFLSLKKGQAQEMSDMSGNAVLVENVQDSVSLGSPDYIDDLISGLKEMKEELE